MALVASAAFQAKLSDTMGVPERGSSAPESSTAQVSSQGHLSMGLTLLCITTWQPTAGVDLGSLCGLRKEKILQAARQPRAGNDWQQGQDD